MRNKVYTYAILITLDIIFIIPSVALSSSDEGLQIDIKKFSIQVRMNIDDFSDVYSKENYISISLI